MQDYVDKIKVKEVLEKAGYASTCSKLIKSFSNIKELKRFVKEHKRDTFVVKLNHTSGDVYFYNNGTWREKHGKAINRRVVYANLKYGLKSNYYYYSFEKPYKNIEPKIFVEEYIPSPKNAGLDEYKFFCNYGQVKMINLVKGRQDDKNIKEIFVDENCVPLRVKQQLDTLDINTLVVPKCFNDMKEFASKMSIHFPILRIDLMINVDKFYFCEFTFFDCGGNNIFYPIENNKKIGDLFDLSSIIK